MLNQREIRLITILIGLVIPSLAFAQSWTKMQFDLSGKSLRYSGYVEDRLNPHFHQKTFIVGGNIQTVGKVQFIGGLSYWDHNKCKQETRPYQAVQYKGIRIMQEQRIFYNKKYENRTRIRVQDIEKLTKKITIKVSNETFFQGGYDQNRLVFSGIFPLNVHSTLETGYMFYRGKEVFNALIIKMIWKLQ